MQCCKIRFFNWFSPTVKSCLRSIENGLTTELLYYRLTYYTGFHHIQNFRLVLPLAILLNGSACWIGKKGSDERHRLRRKSIAVSQWHPIVPTKLLFWAWKMLRWLKNSQSAPHVMTFPSCYNELQRHFSYDGVLGKHMYYGSHVPSNFLYTDSMQTNNENRDRIKGTKNSSSCSTHVLLEKIVNEHSCKNQSIKMSLWSILDLFGLSIKTFA